MNAALTWLSHGSWLIENNGARTLLDPFFTGNPAAKHSAADFDQVDSILVSHGHADHVADVEAIAQKTGASVIAMVEVASWFEAKGVAKTIGMNLGGSIELPIGRVKFTHALHSSSMPDGSYGGNPAGFLIDLSGTMIYFACDTALFSDMGMICPGHLDLAVLPIGDHFTMGIADSVEATKLLGATKVVPAHYNTFPPIEQDVSIWAHRVRTQTSAEPVVLEIGESIVLQ